IASAFVVCLGSTERPQHNRPGFPAPLPLPSPTTAAPRLGSPGLNFITPKEERMGQPVVHWELWSQDPQKVSDFYAGIFGWSIRHLPEMNYRLVETGGQGGIN